MKTITAFLFLISLFSNRVIANDHENEFLDKLIYQFDEEKFAQDYYNAMYNQWNLLAFKNLAKCEATHMKVIKGLIDAYGDPNSVKVLEPGVFAEKDLNNSYKDLIAAGKKNENDALIHAGNFEEKYIGNLEELLEFPEGQANKECLNNLLESSVSHLNLLVCHLRHRGIDYKPVLLSVSKYIKCVGDQYSDLDKASVNCPNEKDKPNCP